MKKPINLNEENISIVELLEKEMRKRHTFTQSDIELFEQAKEIHSEELKSAYLRGIANYDPTFPKEKI
jgi:lipoate synthase